MVTLCIVQARGLPDGGLSGSSEDESDMDVQEADLVGEDSSRTINSKEGKGLKQKAKSKNVSISQKLEYSFN